MTFQVSGRGPGGAVSQSHHDTPAEAFSHVIELMTKGLVEVRITDALGRRWTPTEFAKELDDPPNEVDILMP